MANIHFLSVFFMSGTFTIESAMRTVAVTALCKTSKASSTISTSIHIWKRNKNFYVACTFLFPTQFITIFNVLLRHGPTAVLMKSICVVLCFICGRWCALVQKWVRNFVDELVFRCSTYHGRSSRSPTSIANNWSFNGAHNVLT